MASAVASSLMQSSSSCAAAAAPCFVNKQSKLLPFSNLSSLPMKLNQPRRMAVRASQQPTEPESAQPKVASAEAQTGPATEMKSSGSKASAPKPAKKPSFWDVMAFDGAAPETINGRLAMVGFLSALAVEAQRGEGLVAQIGESQGLQWFFVASAVISAASLVPMLKGVSRESRSGAIMSVQAETWNGRAAMLGLVGLAVTEFLTQAPLV